MCNCTFVQLYLTRRLYFRISSRLACSGLRNSGTRKSKKRANTQFKKCENWGEIGPFFTSSRPIFVHFIFARVCFVIFPAFLLLKSQSHIVQHNKQNKTQKIDENYLVQYNKQFHKEILLRSFHLNSHTLGLYPDSKLRTMLYNITNSTAGMNC